MMLSCPIGLLAIGLISSCGPVPANKQKNASKDLRLTGTIYESMQNGWIWRVSEDHNGMTRSSWNFGPEDEDVSIRYKLTTCDNNFPESICVEGWPVPLTFQGKSYKSANLQSDVNFIKQYNIFFKVGSTDCVRLKSQWETPETSGEAGLWLSYAVFCNGQGYTTLSLVKVANAEGNVVQSSPESDNLVLAQGAGLRAGCRFGPPNGASREPESIITFEC